MPRRAELYKPGEDTLQQGAVIIQVANTKLAACLLAVGVPLYESRPDKPDTIPPYVRLKLKSGKIRTVYNFYPKSQDGMYSTSTLVRAWDHDLDYIAENPDCPFAAAMATVKNLEKINEHFHSVDTKPRVAFVVPTDNGTGTLMVTEGSKKHKAAIARGYKQK